MASIGWTIPDALALRIAVALADASGQPAPKTAADAVAVIKKWVEQEAGRLTIDYEIAQLIRAKRNDTTDPLYDPRYADQRAALRAGE